MKTGFTRIVVLVDRSGSMSSVRTATVSGINEFITAQKSEPGEATIKIVQFDTDGTNLSYDVILDKPLQDVTPITVDQYTPRGLTPLNDATGRTINDLGTELRNLNEEARPEKVLVCIVTDGLENASREFTKGRIKEMVEHQQTKYNWKFTYVGANVDAVTEAIQYGILASATMQFSADEAHTKSAFRGMSAYSGRVRAAAASDVQKIAYTQAERLESVDENDEHAKNANIIVPTD